MKVGIFFPGVLTKTDGLCHFYRQLRKEIKGIELHFFLSVSKAPVDNDPFIHYIELPAAYEWYPEIPTCANPFLLGQVSRKIREALMREKIELVQIAAPEVYCWLAARVAKDLRIPVIGNYHTRIPDYAGYWAKQKWGEFTAGLVKSLLRWWDKVVYNKCELVLVPTPYLERILGSEGFKAPLRILARGVDHDVFTAGKKGNKVKALYVGRLAAAKDLEQLGFLKKDVVLVGGGPYEQEIKKHLPLAEFTGFLRGEKLTKEFGKADVFVFPSVTDTFSNSVLEAMSAGLPVVGYAGACLGDRVEHGVNGYLAQNFTEFQHYVEELMKDTKKREKFGKAARKKALQYSWKKIAREFEEIVKEFQKPALKEKK